MEDLEQELNSVAVWLESPSDSEKEPYLHLDVNIWATKKEQDNYLEIGFKIFCWDDLAKICCILPFDLSSKDVKDKGSYLRENHNVLSALFNETVNLNAHSDNEQFIKVNFPDTEKESSLFLFCPEGNFLEVKPLEKPGGVKLEVNLPEKEDRPPCADGALYVRLRFKTACMHRVRFKTPCLEPIVKVNDSPASVLSGKSEVISFVDFKINSHRSLPWNVQAKVKRTRILSINTFLMTDAWNKIVFDSNGLHASRLLEHHIWNEYLDDTGTKSQKESNETNLIVAYHWKQKAEKKDDKEVEDKSEEDLSKIIQYKWIQSYNIFIKLYRVETTLKSLTRTILYVIIFGSIAGVLGALFANLFGLN